GVEGFREAVKACAWFGSGDFFAELNDGRGAKTWPLTMGTYVAVPRVSDTEGRTERARRFVTWAYLHADALARQAKFVPLPAKARANASREIARIASRNGEPVGAKLLGQLVR